MTENQENSLKAIKELLGYKFVVPAYQRGYRWGDAEVRALLEDVWGFAQKLEEEREKQKQGEGGGQNPAPKSTSAPANAGGDQKSDGQNQGDDKKGAEFYCLQPVVVCEVSGGDSASEKKTYNLIDGQQRLTTIYLILKYLGGVSKDEIGKNDQKHFSLEYATRDESTRFLEGLPVGGDLWGGFIGDRSDDSMDIAHFKNACRVIGGFFKGKEERVRCLGEENQRKFKDTLLKSCKVLWYEPLLEQKNKESVGQKDDGKQVKDSSAKGSKKTAEEEIFVKFNAYKIRLTDEENIKALFLSKDNGLGEGEVETRAKIWYDTELNLREEDDFRYLTLRKIDKKDIIEIDGKRMVSDNIMRIGAYLEAISGKSGGEMFEKFHELYKNRKKPQEGEEPNFEDKWGELKKCVEVFEDLTSKNTEHRDLDIYHYLGFLIQCDKKLDFMHEAWDNDKGRASFRDKLFDDIKKQMSEKLKGGLDNLTYEDGDAVRKALLLFNTECSKEVSEHFAFNRFQLEEWDLEHIQAKKFNITSDKEEAKKDIGFYLQEVKEYWCEGKEELKKKIEAFSEKNSEDERNKLLEEIEQMLESREEIHKIGNLALLNQGINRSIKDSSFRKKREVVNRASKGQKSQFVPIATKKVFNKEFSEGLENPYFFTPKDQDKYFEAIKKAIEKFLPAKKEKKK